MLGIGDKYEKNTIMYNSNNLSHNIDYWNSFPN